MAEFTFSIKGALSAKNFESGQKKCQELKERLEKAGFEYCEVNLEGKPTSSPDK